MKFYFKTFPILLILFGTFFPNHYSLAVSDEIKIFQSVITGTPCNNNGFCDVIWGETSITCSADCIIPGAVINIPLTPKAKDLSINNNAEYTISQDVTLSIFAEKAMQMAISNNQNFSNSSWEEYKTLKNWILDSSNGQKAVYIKFRSQEGGESQVIARTIILDTNPPANIVNFEAVGEDAKINLHWENPVEDFKGVKIMRSTDFYPQTPDDGQLIYNNVGGYYVDTNVKNGTRYYYTAFVYDGAGNYSSGAIASAIPQKPLTPGEKPIEIPPFPEDIMSMIVPSEEIAKLTPKDFNFIQGEKEIPFLDPEQTKFKAIYGEPLTISIPYEKFPEVLKTIMVTLEKPATIQDENQQVTEKKTFSFLLRVNENKTAYLATLVPPEPGEYPLKITILDYKNNSLKKITGELVISASAIPVVVTPWYKNLLEKPYITYIYIVVISMIVLVIMEYIFRRRRAIKIKNNG